MEHFFVVPDLGYGGIFDVAEDIIPEEILRAGEDGPVPEDDQRVPKECARRKIFTTPLCLHLSRPVVVFSDLQFVERQSLEFVEEFPPLGSVGFGPFVREIYQLYNGVGLFALQFFLDFEKTDNIADCFIEIAADADPLVSVFIVPVKGERELIDPGFDKLVRFLLIQERAVGVELDDQFFIMGISGHLEKLRVEERFPPVEKVDIEGESRHFVDDLFKQVELHESLVFFVQVLVRTHHAFQVAVTCRFDPQANGFLLQLDFFSLVAEEESP